MNNSEGFVRSHFCVPLRMSPCLTRFCISNVTTSSRTTYVFSDSVEQRNRTMSCCYSASARLRECSCTPVSCSGGRGPLLLPEFSKALDTPPLQGELLEVETMPCLLLNPWCPAPHLAHRTCSDGYMGTLMSSWTPRSTESKMDLSSLFHHHPTLFFQRRSHFCLLKTLLLSYKGLSLLGSIVP